MKKTLILTVMIAVTAGGVYSSQIFASPNIPTPVFPQISTNISPIQDKMLNAIDNYKSVKGSYDFMSKQLGFEKTVEFEIDENDPGSYVKHFFKSGNIIEQKSDSETLLTYEVQKNEYTKHKVDKSTFGKKPNGSTPRISLDQDNIPKWYHRQDPSLAFGANEVTFPQNYAFWLANGYQELGHEQFLKRDATVLQGKLDPLMAQKHLATDYKMWVDTETGILLQLVETNESGEVITKIEVKQIKINDTVDRKKFSTVPPANAKEQN